MTDDIVERLRELSQHRLYSVRTVMEQAADDIERLRARVALLEERGDVLAQVAHLETQGHCVGHRAWKPIKAWREARRG